MVLEVDKSRVNENERGIIVLDTNLSLAVIEKLLWRFTKSKG